ncbi:MAG: hypothetical protein ACPGUU_00615 [Flavobacteriaceae bacterium]
MSKNIDDIFKNKLKDFKSPPPKEAWDNIVSNLPKKKKRRILPMWWIGGAAAILLISLLIFPISDDVNNSLPVKEESIIIAAPEIKENIDSIIKIKTNETLISTKVKKNKKTPFVNSFKNKHKNNTVNKNKNLSDLVDTKIAKNEVKPVKNNAMKKIILNEDKSNKIAKKPFESISKQKKDLSIEIAKNEKKQNMLTKKESRKWSLTPVVALLSSNSFSKNSPLDETLANNPTKGTNSISYGIKVAYQINNNWEIQSGVHLQKTDYVNNDISIISNVFGVGLTSLQSNIPFSVGTSNSSSSLPILSGAKVVSSTASLTQTYGYIEVPLEIKYTFLRGDKFKSKIVTGFSSLFLTNNTISVDSNVLSQEIGQANNLNIVNFSGNIGLDFDYSIHKSFKLNLNPMFKLQLNTYSKNSNGFKPFILGFYSGIKYQF